ncbi:acetyltransferase (GNAT) family protein [Halomonas ventosae]|uniref:Acetyltransferase (GNAT) family protein n=1 Tax=Halomonas ventosae TaxID=229007 RepID=A0A4R6ZWQ1_9GAMM|nr:GNAT family N-acetyltransferase [Halomonas ventosae]TDR56699.1 acetyltransferase (GNAT) family protein [Halomonas ventosae]
MTLTISIPGDTDHDDWRRLYRGYAEYYGMPMDESTLATVWDWIQDGTRLQGLLARDANGQAVGLMHFRAMPSPLRGAIVGFLDDLFVDPAHRGTGAVDEMMEALRQEARRQGWPFVRWITRENNYRARGVYDRCAKRTDWVTYQLDP